jgi:hypothetical protein
MRVPVSLQSPVDALSLLVLGLMEDGQMADLVNEVSWVCGHSRTYWHAAPSTHSSLPSTMRNPWAHNRTHLLLLQDFPPNPGANCPVAKASTDLRSLTIEDMAGVFLFQGICMLIALAFYSFRAWKAKKGYSKAAAPMYGKGSEGEAPASLAAVHGSSVNGKDECKV